MMSTGRSQRSFRRAGAAVGLTVALIACSADQPHAGETSPVGGTDTIAAPEVVVGSQPPVAPAPTSTTVVETAPIDEAPVTPVLGDVEVAVVQHLPRLDLRWVESELDVPEQMQAGFGFVFAGFVAGEAVVVGQSSTVSGPQAFSTWRSTDGNTWNRADQLLEPNVWIHGVFVRDDQLVAVGNHQIHNSQELVILGTDADARWEPIDLGGSIDPEGLTSWLHTSNGAGVVLVAERYDTGAHELEPLTMVIWDHELVLDEGAGTFALIDRRSGEVTSSGFTSEIYPWSEDGQAVWKLDTRELLTVVPWDVWGRAWPTGPPLPIPVPEHDVAIPSIEWDGYRIMIDDSNGRVEIFASETGELIQSIGHAEFYRGPSPQFRDDETGELVWAPTWAEWDQLVHWAYDQAYERQQEAPVAAEPQRLLLVSPDGIEWTEIELDFLDPVDGYVDSLWSVAGEYQLVVVEHGMGESARRLYRSPDGIEWTATELAGEQMIVAAPTAGPNGVVTASASPMGGDDPTLKTSPDGITWTPAFQLGEQDDGRHVWFELLASGPGGHGAIVTLVPQDEQVALTITLDGRTARFGYGETAVTITDRNGDVLLEASWQDMEMAYMGERDPIATYDDGVTTFWSPDGSPVMRIPDESVSAEYEGRHEANVDRTDRVLFLERAGAWYEVEVPMTGHEWVQLMAIGDDMVVVAVGQWGEPGFECCEGETNPLASMRVLVGHFDSDAG